MFKFGEYSEDEARDIANYLKEVGMKVDIRTFTNGRLEVFNYLEGRMSELKGDIEEKEFEDYERFINALRAILARGATAENFREMLRIELDPAVNDKGRQVSEIFEGSLPEEERKIIIQNFVANMMDLSNISGAEYFVNIVLVRNKIQIGEEVGDRLDDPILRIFSHPEDGHEGHRLARTTRTLIFEQRAQVYIDEFSAIAAEEIDDEFKEEYGEEFFKISNLGKLISGLAEPFSGKMDMKSLSERCNFQSEDDGNILKVIGKGSAPEMARALEKNGIIKVKGDIIKWKR